MPTFLHLCSSGRHQWRRSRWKTSRWVAFEDQGFSVRFKHNNSCLSALCKSNRMKDIQSSFSSELPPKTSISNFSSNRLTFSRVQGGLPLTSKNSNRPCCLITHPVGGLVQVFQKVSSKSLRFEKRVEHNYPTCPPPHAPPCSRLPHILNSSEKLEFCVIPSQFIEYLEARYSSKYAARNTPKSTLPPRISLAESRCSCRWSCLSSILKQVSNMANAGSGSLATILFLFMFPAALPKGRTFPVMQVFCAHFPLGFPRI